MSRRRIWQCIVISTVLVSPVRGASFEGLGDLSGGYFYSSASAVSGDGSVIVGGGTTAAGAQAFRWTQSAGMVSLGNLPNNSFRASGASMISADGSTIVGWGNTSGSWSYYTNRAFRWTQAGGMAAIPPLNGTTNADAEGVSADGSVVVGHSGSQAYRWTQSGGTQGLGYLPGMVMSRSLAVSGDGSVVVGSSFLSNFVNEQAFRWTQSGGMEALGFLPGDSNDSWADDISPDGSVIVGTSGASHPFRWTQSTGMVSIGGHLPGMNVTHALDVSNLGSKIVGVSYSNVTNRADAFIWDESHGMRDLQSVLQADYGLDLTGWDLRVAYGVSADGNVIVGEGINPLGMTEAFLVTLVPEPSAMSLLAIGGMCLLARRRI